MLNIDFCDFINPTVWTLIRREGSTVTGLPAPGKFFLPIFREAFRFPFYNRVREKIISFDVMRQEIPPVGKGNP
jgi:hypothetical protein